MLALKCVPTPRAADGRESARFTGIFQGSGSFLLSGFCPLSPPSAANASRWQAEPKSKCKTVFESQGFVLRLAPRLES
jgi:hypothetical protein